MKICIIGAGSIGATLARRLVIAGHSVRVAISRVSETLREIAEQIGASRSDHLTTADFVWHNRTRGA